MQELRLARPESEALRVLCLGAHADDIEIGCAGTLLRLLAERPGAEVRWTVFSATREREREARASAERLAEEAASLTVDVFDFRDGYFPDCWADLKTAMEELAEKPSPDLVFTHRGGDRHQDHRVVSQLTWQTFRDHLILEYEVPKYDGDLGQPNLYVPLSDDVARRKTRHLLEAFPSQRARSWFDEETFLGLLRLRGIECGGATNHAEAFHARKTVVTWTARSDPSRSP